MNLNRVIITGNLTDAPRSFADGKGAEFTVAVNGREKRGDEWQERTEFVDVSCFGRTAENAVKYLSKGAPVAIDGKLRLDRWEKDGQKRSKLKVVADTVQFTGSRNDAPAEQREEPIPF